MDRAVLRNQEELHVVDVADQRGAELHMQVGVAGSDDGRSRLPFHHPAQPFLSPAVDRVIPRATEIIEPVVRPAIARIP